MLIMMYSSSYRWFYHVLSQNHEYLIDCLVDTSDRGLTAGHYLIRRSDKLEAHELNNLVVMAPTGHMIIGRIIRVDCKLDV